VQGWIKNDLKNVNQDQPVVVVSHFNLKGPFSDWWGKDWHSPLGNINFQSAKSAKDALFGILKKYNVKGFFSGHWHKNYTEMWNDKIPTSGVGGAGYAIGNYNPETHDISVEFKK